jgi:mycofactocin glycosyltransferase
MRTAWDDRNRLWGAEHYLAGGAPWGLIRLSPQARAFVRRLRSAGPAGLEATTPTERALADRLVARGVAHPVPEPRQLSRDLAVVIPAHDRPELLDACLRGLGPVEITVVDDASLDAAAIRRVAEAHGARLVRHATNQGPAAARNTGLAHTDAPIVAFLDSDCTVPPGWLELLIGHFDDPRVGLVAPRVRPSAPGGPRDESVLARHEDARSALDMGGRPELVRHGARLGFLPSAALLARRSALPEAGFDPAMRVGEDVDLVWRTIEAGWHVRYEPAVTVHHQMRLDPLEWARRRFDYGTSAAALDRRHPGRLTPARISAWNLAIAAMVVAGRPVAGAGVAVVTVASLGRGLTQSGVPAELAVRVVAKGLVADVVGVGHALRREWWPMGWFALASARRSRSGRFATLAMLAPLALEYARTRPRVDPVRYAALRLVEDAAYGSGVLASVVRARQPRALLPYVRLPSSPGS